MSSSCLMPKLKTSQTPINKLTIYSQSGHIVQYYPPGTKNIILPKSVEIGSIVVIDSDGIVVPFSYIPETNISDKLTNRATGDKVNATVVKDGATINGKILSMDGDNITLSVNNQITIIHKYSSITINTTDEFTRSHLLLERGDKITAGYPIGSASTLDKPIILSYLLSNISWSCVGTALIDNINNIMYLRLTGNIINNTESDISAKTTLVSGEVNQYRRNTYESRAPRGAMMLAATPSPIESNRVQISMLEDYTKYEVGDRIIHNKDIAELGTWSCPIIKLYTHETNSNNKVKFGYRFDAPGFIPSCSVNVYSTDKNKIIDSYLGSDNIEEAQKNNTIDIILGESTLLQCKSLIVISDVTVKDENIAKQYNLPLESQKNDVNSPSEWHIITEDLSVEITNYNLNIASLVIKHYVGNKLLINANCQAYKKRENGFIEWYFQISPQINNEPRKEKFICQIITAVYE